MLIMHDLYYSNILREDDFRAKIFCETRWEHVLESSQITRHRVVIQGIVQGVGFRPFVYNLAAHYGFSGFVRNVGAAVEAEIQGPDTSFAQFLQELRKSAPHRSMVTEISAIGIAVQNEASFEIKESLSPCEMPYNSSLMSPDIATCNQCISELFDERNRRYRYPFINCTDCGPRLSITTKLPYDRRNTSMCEFKMCFECQREYDDPSNRRFHAQPNACADCGPQLRLISNNRNLLGSSQSLEDVVRLLRSGAVVAVKGIGGYHLFADAQNPSAVESIRRRKQRPHKPFAVMFQNCDAVRLYCELTSDEEDIVSRVDCPIALLKKLDTAPLPENIAPGTDRVGVLLPYSPLHHVLLRDFGGPVVATSANISEEPIIADDPDSVERLLLVSDAILTNNRVICNRFDDSVVQADGKDVTVLRRARGFAPLPVNFPYASNIDILSCGAHVKNTFACLRKNQIFISPHIGDLSTIESVNHFQNTLASYETLFGLRIKAVVCDLHHGYGSTNIAKEIARERQLPLLHAQHHHAHVVSCMIEHRLTGPVLAFAFDGSGAGPDGSIWGGEVFIADYKQYVRVAHLEQFSMPGGVAAIRAPWRMALSMAESRTGMRQAYFEKLLQEFGPQVQTVRALLNSNFNSPLTSSAGRLFDAMSSLLGICAEVDYEGQAAVELECLATVGLAKLPNAKRQSYPFQISMQTQPWVVKTGEILESAFADCISGVPPDIVAAKFHCTVAKMIFDLATLFHAHRPELTDVCMGGGVFQNRLLRLLVRSLFEDQISLKIYFPEMVPCNDGGISIGQTGIAYANLNEGYAENPIFESWLSCV